MRESETRKNSGQATIEKQNGKRHKEKTRGTSRKVIYLKKEIWYYNRKNVVELQPADKNRPNGE
jgi:hypothetical protein